METGKILLAAAVFLALLSGAAFAQLCQSYDQNCVGAPGVGNCCDGLHCETFTSASGTINRCTQVNSNCSVMPGTYVAPIGDVLAGPLANGTVNKTLELQLGRGVIGSGSGIYQTGWFSDWHTAGVIGVMIAIAIIAIAAIIGRAFNLPEVKAFADTELMQAVISVLLIGGLLGLIGFFDIVAREALEVGNLPINCNADPSQPCYITAAKFYIDSLYGTANQYAQTALSESITTQATASRGVSWQANWWVFLYVGSNIRSNAGMSIQAERAATIFETVSKLMASLYAQRYFIDVISFGIAPLFLLLGIILRTFFFTRKLGGLMLAIAISLFIIYPLTYAFAWYTLNVTVYGERTFGTSDPNCPSECSARYPVAFFVNDTGTLVKFETTQAIMRAGITEANWASGDVDGDGTGEFPGLVSCRNLEKIGITNNSCSGCPDYCRDVPFQPNMPGCSISACSSCNAGCKIMRQRTDCNVQCNMSSCNQFCRTKLPTENKCFFADEILGSENVRPANLSATCGGCSVCPNWCKFLSNATGTLEMVYKNDKGCSACASAFASNACPVQCMYLTEVGKSTSCDMACAGCPEFCRVNELSDAGWVNTYDIIPTDPTALSINELCTKDTATIAACAACPKGCKIDAGTQPPYPQNLTCAPYPQNGVPVGTTCESCPEYCRYPDFNFITGYSYVPEDTSGVPWSCTTAADASLDCSASACNADCDANPDPPTCRAYNSSDSDTDYCRDCPQEMRAILSLTNSTGLVEYSGPPLFDSSLTCAAPECSDSCKMPVVVPESDAQSCTPTAPGSASADIPLFYGSDGWNMMSNPLNTSVAFDVTFPCITEAYEYDGNYVHLALGDMMVPGKGYWVKITTTPSCIADPSLPCCVGHLTGDGFNDNVGENSTYDGWHMVGAPHATVSVSDFMGNCIQDSPAFYYDTLANTNVESTNLEPGKGYWLKLLNATCQMGTAPPPPCIQPLDICLDYNASYSSSFEPTNCQLCKPACRVNVSDPDWLDSSCTTVTLAGVGTFNPCDDAHCPYTCKADLSVSPTPLCSEYLGNGGTESCQGPTSPFNCPGLGSDYTSCLAHDTDGCYWGTGSYTCFGPTSAGSPPIDCTAITSETSCMGNASIGCYWEQEGSINIPIAERIPPYDERRGCRQCPENCRINGYEGDCGVGGADGERVDCTQSNLACPSFCRTNVPIDGVTCSGYTGDDTKACQGCPALCRRSPDVRPSGDCPPECDIGAGCTSDCMLPDPQVRQCDGCFDCPIDCTYYPAVRSDCSEVCSDEALAGPANIAPDDFFKALPGAQGAIDVKNVGVLMVPALVLPLFCIVIVVAFIRVFSPILGGDIEIPGLGRII